MDRSEHTLSPRQRDILATLVREHITSAIPVGSSTIREMGRLRVSSATIRSELVELEDLGFIHQPHTSAGRVPTVRGYRYFVEQLMSHSDLPVPEQRMIHHQFHQLRMDFDQWMRLTAAILAQTVRTASLVTAPRAARSRYRHLELISVSERMFLLVLVLQDGSIHQEMFSAEEPISQAELSQTSNRLNTLAHDMAVPELRLLDHPDIEHLRDWEAEVLARVLGRMSQVDRQSVSQIYSDGLMNVIQQPEYVDAERFRRIVEVLEHRGMLESILGDILTANGVRVIIGGEGDYEEIDDVSLVLSPYGVKGLASGVLGIMGPNRLPYGRAISTVRYVAQLLNSMLGDLYGSIEEED